MRKTVENHGTDVIVWTRREKDHRKAGERTEMDVMRACLHL